MNYDKEIKFIDIKIIQISYVEYNKSTIKLVLKRALYISIAIFNLILVKVLR